eukprot:TRINITY_DN1706_c0_g1_i1.p3 TRINITY_DN1706_c0_g1~~TRINITY_DN1706_c0_g1_i1.p3  ORF type:complete len:161 (-),score=20.64 TRINITY_DN1706_c0_g1_i1:276-758(-)
MAQNEDKVDYKSVGNTAFKKGEWLSAAAQYTKAIKQHSISPLSDQDLAVLHSNRCAALCKLGKAQKALADAEECVKLRPDWGKSYFRMGQVMELQENIDQALGYYQQASKLTPDSKDTSAKVRELQNQVQIMKQKEKLEKEKLENKNKNKNQNEPVGVKV